MKRGILFVALGMTVAGVASASVFTAASSPVTPRPQPPEAVAVAHPVSPPEVAPPAVVQPVVQASQPVVQKASVEPRKAPVPLQVKHRPPVDLPAVEAKATEPTPDAAKSQEAAAPSGDASGENAAKAAIEADGYKGVRVLRKGENGVWHATALRGKTVVPLMVDASGSVSTAE
jgi:hypothetical protein